MKKILEYLNSIYNVLGLQEYDPNKKYRISPFIIKEEVANGYLIYNTLTCEMVFATDEDLTESQEYFVLRWFLIDKDIDPYSMCKTFKRIWTHMKKRKYMGKIAQYVIFTTTNCNARCKYCYESGCLKEDMSVETAQKVAEYINMTTNGNVSIQWFGGEPLYNAQAINIISERLRESFFPYSSTIVSNGYLFDQCDIKTLKDLWKLDKVQITLDGTEDNYNVAKAYVEACENPFDKVLNNIEYLVSNDIGVTVRMNLSNDNIDDMHSLIDLLHERFGKYKRFSAYSHPLFDGGSFHGACTKEEHREITEGYIAIQEHLKRCGLCGDYPIDKVRITEYCMANSMSSVTISPSGKVGLCEHYPDTELIGNIQTDTDKFDKRVVSAWQELYESIECRTCPLYPQCAKIKKCPTSECNAEWRDHLEFQIRDSMRNTYKKYKEEQSTR